MQNILLVMVVCVAMVMTWGDRLPREQHAQNSFSYLTPREKVWPIISDPSDPSWRTPVKQWAYDRHQGVEKWLEVDRFGNGITYQTKESTAPVKFSYDIIETPHLSGSTTIELKVNGMGGTSVYIDKTLKTDDFWSTVRMNILHKQPDEIEQYFKDLAGRLGESYE